MKRNSQTTPPTIETVETLRQQLDSIARSLAVESEHERAEHAAAAERARVERETAQYEQRQAALAQARAATKTAVDAIMQLDGGAMAELDKAVDDLARCGATAPYTTGALYAFRQQLTGCLARIADLEPLLVGKPPHATAAERAISEARAAVATAESNLQAISRISYGGENRALSVERAGEALRLAQKRLCELTGESFVLANLQSRIARLVSTPPMRQAESETML